MAEGDDIDEGEQVMPSVEELRRLAEVFATPINVDSLIAAGVLTKRSGGWYEVHKWSELPEHARRKVQAVRSGTKGAFVKFCKHDDRLAKLFG